MNSVVKKLKQMKKVLVLISLILYQITNIDAQNHLKFDKKGEFKILQFTDCHYNAVTDKSKKTFSVIENMITKVNPDLIVFTGDVVTHKQARKSWDKLTTLLESKKIPWTITLGNHDHEGDMSNKDIIKYIDKFEYNYSGKRAKNFYGEGNYVLPIKPNNKRNTSSLLYFINSNSYTNNKKLGTYDWIKTPQISWYEKTSKKYTKKNNNKPLPALAFFHIPLPEYNDVVAGKKFIGKADEKVCSPHLNSGLFCKMVEMDDVMGCFVGHDHENDFIGLHTNIALAYGRASGYDTYGKKKKGARVIILHENEFKFDTYVVTADEELYKFNYVRSK